LRTRLGPESGVDIGPQGGIVGSEACGQVALSGETTIDRTGDGATGGDVRESGIRVRLPLKSAGEVVGVMCVCFEPRRVLLEREKELLESVAAQVGVATKKRSSIGGCRVSLSWRSAIESRERCTTALLRCWGT
jgi:hypothetical protein